MLCKESCSLYIGLNWVGHWFTRKFLEWPRWRRRKRVYFGGIQDDVFHSGKQRAHVTLIRKDLGLFFRSGVLEQATERAVSWVAAADAEPKGYL